MVAKNALLYIVYKTYNFIDIITIMRIVKKLKIIVYLYLLFLLYSCRMLISGTKWYEVAFSGGDWMFMGEYNHTIDTKGRLIIPSKFRETLGDSFVVTKGLDGCLFVYDNNEWASFEEKLKTLPLMNKESRKFVRFFLAGATEAEVDKQGRILLPAVLREHAGLEKDVVLVGVGVRIEIWSKERWDEASEYDDMDEIAGNMSSLGLMI